jgi:hypothetical protein
MTFWQDFTFRLRQISGVSLRKVTDALEHEQQAMPPGGKFMSSVAVVVLTWLAVPVLCRQ